jgi:hypothetical protein
MDKLAPELFGGAFLSLSRAELSLSAYGPKPVQLFGYLEKKVLCNVHANNREWFFSHYRDFGWFYLSSNE